MMSKKLKRINVKIKTIKVKIIMIKDSSIITTKIINQVTIFLLNNYYKSYLGRDKIIKIKKI